MAQRVLFFDLLRCLAAVAVVLIHALGPYRHLMGDIPFEDWSIAVGLNSVSRWAVPVFIMITGALLLSDARPFQAKVFFQKRFAKVLIPFLAWSAFYAVFSGWTGNGFDWQPVTQAIGDFVHHQTYYHLGFFYYFLPLYFLVPIYRWVITVHGTTGIWLFIAIWLFTTTLFMLRVDGPWSNQIWLFSGYLMLGYALYQVAPLTNRNLWLAFSLGTIALLATIYWVIGGSVDNGEYTVGRWLSYKTINTVLAASMIFMLCRKYADGLSQSTLKIVAFISRYSLGIYLLHPIFLWPLYQLEWPLLHPLVGLPLWIVFSGGSALLCSWWLAKYKVTRWLVP